jgi:hypothetical protein
MKYAILLISLVFGVTVQAASSTEVPLAEAHDNDAPPVKLDIPGQEKPPLLTPYITLDGKRGELVNPNIGEPYAIVPHENEAPDPLDNAEETNTDTQWELLTW